MPVYVFGDFEIDDERIELRRRGDPVPIAPRAFDLLAYLIRHRDRAVSKIELMSKVWGVVALSSAAVPTCIGEVRRALGDRDGSRGLIVTLAKRGYRFGAEVQVRGESIASRATGDPAPRDDIRPGTIPFVGRGRELNTLGAALGEVQTRRPQLIFLTGEAGIGKTRTAEEFLRRAQAEGATAIISRCHEGDGAPAFWPWEQVARGCIDLCMQSGIAEALAPLFPMLAPLLPEITDPNSSDSPSFASHDPQAPRFRLFDGVTRLLERAADQQPVVIMIDDLHRADPASLHLLQFVIRELRDARILIVGTYRDAALPSDSSAVQVLGSLIREPRSRNLALEGFSRKDVAEYLAAIHAEGATDAKLPEALHDRSGGNPFFLTQLVQLLASLQETPAWSEIMSSGVSLPRGVRQAITQQIEGLSESTRQILAAASVMGREFQLAELATALDLPIDIVLAATSAAREHRLVTSLPDRSRIYRFVHVLLRDALYEGIAPVERSALHRRIGEAIEAHSAGDLDSRAPELAHHFLSASQGGSTRDAIRYSIRAARRAARQLAFEDACRHYRLAAGLLEPSDERGVLERCEILLALGEAELRAGERTSSRETLLRVAQLTRAIPAPELLARVALGLAPGLFAIEAGVVDPVLISLLEEAHSALGPSDSSLRAQVLARLATALVWSDAEERRDVLSREALGAARRLGDPATLGMALIARHGVSWSPQRLSERMSVLIELGRCAQESSSDGLSLVHRVLEIALHFELGDIDAADREIERFSLSAKKHRDPHAMWYADLFACVRATMEGRSLDATERSQAFLEGGRRVGDLNAIHAYGAQRVARCWDEGRPEDVIENLEEMVGSFPTVFAWKGALAISYLEAGRSDDARRAFEQLASHDFRNMPWNEAGTINFCFLAELAAAFRDQRRAALLYEILLPAASHFAIAGYASVFRGSIARHLGLLAATLGRFDAATEHFEYALHQNTRVGAAPFVAQAQYDYARAILRRNESNDLDLARSHVSNALEITGRLGLPRLHESLLALEAALASNRAPTL